MNGVLRRVARFVAGRLMPRRPYKVLKGPMKGARLVLGSLSGKGGGATAYFGEMEPRQTAAMAAEIRPGNVVFDIGANVGYYTILASRVAGPSGKVVAFEPLLRNIEFLRRHVELNNAANVVVMPVALSDTTGSARFSIGDNSAVGHIGSDGEIEVETTTVDAVIERLGFIPDVMKIDVEGAEKAVLTGAQGMFERVKPTIFLSTHSDELREWCTNYLVGLGYLVAKVALDGDPHELVARYAV